MERLFGTNGVRGVVNKDLSLQLIIDLGMAIGTHFQGGEIVVGSDTRTSSEMIKSAVVSGLLATGCKVTDVGVVPTPALQLEVKLSTADGGIAVTASHNPPEFNGVKCIDSEGMELPRSEEEKIERIYFDRLFALKPWNHIRPVRRVETVNKRYIDSIVQNGMVEKIAGANLTVVVDCANGACCHTSPYIVTRMGCTLHTLNCQPDGSFPGHPSEPTEKNLKDLLSLVPSLGADLGVAHDGDGDRAIFVDENGRFITGDKSLAIVASRVVRENGGGLVITPVSTSSCVEEMVRAEGGEVEYTKVGAPIVARTMLARRAVFGGEENGGLIFPNFQYCRDGGMAILKILEILAMEECSLSELIAEVPQYFQVKTSVRCPNELKREALERVIEGHKDEELILVDGVKLIRDRGWLLMRPSGTEPIFRIFAEGETESVANQLAEEGKEELEEIIDSLRVGS